MQVNSRAPAAFRFGDFELDANGTELRQRGVRVHLQPQPLQVLLILVRECGGVVSREDLRQRLWKNETFVGFEDGVNHAISKLRDALGDSVHSPRYIETIPKLGYRFVPSVECIAQRGPDSVTHPPPRPEEKRLGPAREPELFHHLRRAVVLVSIFIVGLMAGIAIWRHIVAVRTRPITSIAVLKLASLSAAQEDILLAEAFTERLINRLDKVGPLRVVPLSAVQSYSGSGKSLLQIGNELHVDAVIEGSLLRNGDRVRVAIKLVRTQAEQSVWAVVVENDSSNMSTMEDHLVNEIVSELKSPSVSTQQ